MSMSKQPKESQQRARRQQEFINTVRGILRKQNQARVEQFIQQLTSTYLPGTPFVKRQTEDDKQHIKHKKDAIKHIERLERFIKNGVIGYRIEGLAEAKRDLKLDIKVMSALNTGGRRSDLTLGDLKDLYKLREAFRNCFHNLSDKYQRHSLLYEMGRALVGKTLPKSIEKILEKPEKALTSYYRELGLNLHEVKKI